MVRRARGAPARGRALSHDGSGDVGPRPRLCGNRLRRVARKRRQRARPPGARLCRSRARDPFPEGSGGRRSAAHDRAGHAEKVHMTLETLKQHRCYGGVQGVYRHASSATRCAMEFAVYVPPQAEHGKVSVLYWLSGLTCTWANFTEKAGMQRHAAAHGLIVVAPDTSPRGTDFPGEHDSYDFGSGAGFYVDATAEPWARNYRMYTYVTKELPALIEASFPVDRGRQGIFGHSMGGHGALVCGLRNSERYRSLSAFAPIAAPIRSPWGEKAFSGYLGDDREGWRAYDATE